MNHDDEMLFLRFFLFLHSSLSSITPDDDEGDPHPPPDENTDVQDNGVRD